MKLVRPGAGAPTISDHDAGAMRRLRRGRLAGALLAAGWLLTLGLTAVAGAPLDASGLLLAFAGAVIGVILARRPWNQQSERSLRLLVAVGALHAAAAMVALDPAATTSIPLFVAVAVLAGVLAPTRAAVLGCAAALGAIALAVAELAPFRTAGAPAHAMALAPALLLAASAAAGVRALLTARALRAEQPRFGDPGLAHAPLVERARQDPDRFARLAMDIDLQAGRGLTRVEGNRLLVDIAEALIAQVRVSAMVRRRATDMLLDRLERTVANIELEELGWFNFEQAYAQPLQDGAEAEEILRRADEALAEARARRGRRPLPAEAPAEAEHLTPAAAWAKPARRGAGDPRTR
jgi:hypothetical protein